MSALAESRVATPQVDNTDLLKAAAIFLVAIDHFAIYFVETEPLDDWLQVVGRLAAPVFFFLIGFATSRAVGAFQTRRKRLAAKQHSGACAALLWPQHARDLCSPVDPFAHYLGDMAAFSVLARVCLLDRA